MVYLHCVRAAECVETAHVSCQGPGLRMVQASPESKHQRIIVIGQFLRRPDFQRDKLPFSPGKRAIVLRFAVACG